MWSANALIIGGEFCGESFKLLDQDRALRKPEGQTGTNVVIEAEELHLASKLAMVALSGFLQHGEVSVKIGLVLEGGAVNALELRVPLVAFKVSACDVCEFESANPPRMRNVRTRAKIRKFPVAMRCNRLAIRNVFNDIELEF